MKLRLFAAIGALAVGLASMTHQSVAQSSSAMDAIKSRGVLKVVTMTTIPPFAFKNEQEQIVGVDIDIAKLVARELLGDASKVEFVSVSGDGRWPAILSGQGDLGIATVYMNRANNVSFSQPVYNVGITLLVAKDLPLKTLKDVNSPSVSVANLNNAQMAARAKTYFPDAKVQTFDQTSAQFLALRTGRVQAMQIDTPIADYFALQNADKVQVMDAQLGDVLHNAIYSRPDDPRWRQVARHVLAGATAWQPVC